MGYGSVASSLCVFRDMAGRCHMFEDVGWNNIADMATAAGVFGAHVSRVYA